MNGLEDAIQAILAAQVQTGKPLSIVLAGHNGSGKSTFWYQKLSDALQLPLINADRMMMSVLPELDPTVGHLPPWAADLRDGNAGWMRVAQEAVQAFVLKAMVAKVPFATETVFSDWRQQTNGDIRSKVDLIRELQAAGFFVLLVFVGLT